MIKEIALSAVLFLAPPAQYDYEPTKPYRVITVPESKIEQACEIKDLPDTMIMFGCSFPHECQVLRTNTDNTLYMAEIDGCVYRIYVIEELSDEAEAIIIRHEKAHLNGWVHENEILKEQQRLLQNRN